MLGVTLEGRYRVESVLGQGGMGSVLLAQDLRMGRPVVVKVPHARFLGEPTFLERFQLEIKSLTALTHPNVVKVLDVGAWEGTPYAVLEHLPGGSLRDRIERGGGRLDPQAVKRWLVPVGDALDAVHAQHLVHRDVKPSNILFDREGNAFLADFGIAKTLGAMDTGLTQTGMTPGSPDYMAPEAISGAPLGPAYDQYALGVVAYQALAGRLPHEASNSVAVLARKAYEPAASLASVAPDVPARVVAVVMRALERDPMRRYPHCGAFGRAYADALDATEAATGAGARAAAATGKPPASRGRSAPGSRRRRVLLAGALALGVLGLAAVAWWQLGGGFGPSGPSATELAARAQAAADQARTEALASLARAAQAGDWEATRPLLAAAASVGVEEARLAGFREGLLAWDAPPEIRVEAPQEGAVVEGPAVRLVGTFTTGRPLDVLTVEGAPVTTDKGGFSIDVPCPAEGLRTVVVAIRDAAGERARTSRAFQVVAPWRRPLEEARQLALAGEWRKVKPLLATIASKGGAVPDPLRAGLDRFDAPPVLTLTGPEADMSTERDVEVVGRLETGRAADRLVADGQDVACDADGRFRARVRLRPGADTEVLLRVLDGEEERATLRRVLRFEPAWWSIVLDARRRFAAQEGDAGSILLDAAVSAGALREELPADLVERDQAIGAGPRVVLDAPVDGSVFTGKGIVVRGRVGRLKSGGTVTVDGSAVEVTDGAFSYDLKLSDAEPGTRSIRVEARGTDGRRSVSVAVTWREPFKVGDDLRDLRALDLDGRTFSMRDLQAIGGDRAWDVIREMALTLGTATDVTRATRVADLPALAKTDAKEAEKARVAFLGATLSRFSLLLTADGGKRWKTLGDVVTFVEASVKQPIVFLAWSPSCSSTRPNEKRIAALVAEAGARFVPVCVDYRPTDQDLRDVLRERGYAWRMLADQDQTLLHLFEVPRTPTLFVADARGVLRYRGPVDDAEENSKKTFLKDVLAALSRGRSSPYAQKESWG